MSPDVHLNIALCPSIVLQEVDPAYSSHTEAAEHYETSRTHKSRHSLTEITLFFLYFLNCGTLKSLYSQYTTPSLVILNPLYISCIHNIKHLIPLLCNTTQVKKTQYIYTHYINKIKCKT